MVRLESRLAQQMVAHARQEAPNECCGLLAGMGGRILHLYPTTNALQSPVRYSVDPRELLRLLKDMDSRGWELVGIYHSHTHTEAYPSATDVQQAYWPECLYFIVSLLGPQPTLRAFRIVQGQIAEEELALEDQAQPPGSVLANREESKEAPPWR